LPKKLAGASDLNAFVMSFEVAGFRQSDYYLCASVGLTLRAMVRRIGSPAPPTGKAIRQAAAG
jgi:hypothetical protein